MSEPVKENPKTSKRSKRKPAMEPLGWDEIVSQPGMGGYLSFLNGPVPLPHLQGAGTALATDPGVVSAPLAATPPESAAATSVTPGPLATPVSLSDSAKDIAPAITADSVVDSAPVSGPIPQEIVIPVSEPIPVPSTPSDVLLNPGVVPNTATRAPAPEVISLPAVVPGRLRIRRCAATHDGHSLGEEVLYQALWKAAVLESAGTRMIVIGWRGMSQLCRMTPKNCKINTQRLIRKLALEVLSPYNTPESIGTTYRIYSDEDILLRRRAAGLEWVVRSRGVEFVDPRTGISIVPICAVTQ